MADGVAGLGGDGGEQFSAAPQHAQAAADSRQAEREVKRAQKRAAAEKARDEELAKVRKAEQEAARVVGKLGRPSSYTPEMGARICGWIADGNSLRSFCRQQGIGSDTVYRWLRENKDFHALYARAHDDRADALADEIQDIADEQQGAASKVEVEAARLRIEARKWIASKLKPSKWGEKVEIERKETVTFNLGLPNRTIDITPTAVPLSHSQAPTVGLQSSASLVERPDT
jgi:hypothetical protein